MNKYKQWWDDFVGAIGLIGIMCAVLYGVWFMVDYSMKYGVVGGPPDYTCYNETIHGICADNLPPSMRE